MDSLTQIVLGAAVAEAAIGKRIGNRAMVWGAIAGTIPDLDVISNAFMSPIDALAFHRGPTHSALYLTILALLLGWLVPWFYRQNWSKTFAIVAWCMLILSIAGGISLLGDWNIIKGIVSLIILLGGGFLLKRQYQRPTYEKPTATIGQWQWMFFLALVTHPILDCFTTYGTQILLPFSSQRVAFNNIAVADPLYTIPFITCLIIAMCYSRHNPRRAKWNYIGLTISSVYMIFTILNKTRINTIFENSLSRDKITYLRYMTTPTILNNVLWSGIAETDTAYFYGTYSFFDKEKKFELNSISKNRATFGEALETDQTLKTLRWFSDDYFQLKRINEDSLEYYDLRFGTFRMKSSDPDQFVFKFNLIEDKENNYILKDQGARPRDANFGEAFAALWRRMMGIK